MVILSLARTFHVAVRISPQPPSLKDTQWVSFALLESRLRTEKNSHLEDRSPNNFTVTADSTCAGVDDINNPSRTAPQ